LRASPLRRLRKVEGFAVEGFAVEEVEQGSTGQMISTSVLINPRLQSWEISALLFKEAVSTAFVSYR